MGRKLLGWIFGLALLVGLGVGLTQLRPAARRLPPTVPAHVILLTRSPVPGQTPLPTPSATPPAQRMVVAGTGGLGLRLREGPGLQYATRAVLPEGTPLWVAPESAEADGMRWRRVRTEDGALEGWVAEAYLAPAEPEATPTPAFSMHEGRPGYASSGWIRP